MIYLRYLQSRIDAHAECLGDALRLMKESVVTTSGGGVLILVSLVMLAGVVLTMPLIPLIAAYHCAHKTGE